MDRVNKRWIIRTGLIFAAVLLTLTFFSNTIYSFNLPRVTVDFAEEGVIRNTAVGEGKAEFLETRSYYAESRGRIELFATEGDVVEAGDKLYAIYSDYEDLQKALETAKSEYERINLKIQKLSYDREYTQISLNNTAVEYTEPDMTSYDYEIERLEKESSQVEEGLKTIKILYESGALPKSSLDEKQRELDSLLSSLEQAEQKKQRALESADEAEKTAIDTYNTKLSILLKTLGDYDYQLKEYMLDKSRTEKNIADLERQIENGGTASVTAEQSGRVISAFNMDVRNYADTNSFIMKLGFNSSGADFYSVIRFPENVDYIFVDDTVTLEVKSKRLYNLQGTVKQVYNEDGFLKTRVEFIAEGLTGGEVVSARSEQSSRPYQNVVPNTAVMYDARQGYYILYAEKVKRLFGYDYYARMMPINIQMQDSRNTAYYMISKEKLAIITNSDKALSPNDRIRIVDGSDIIETR